MTSLSPGMTPKAVVTAEEINVLVHGYLAESFPNAASLFRNEARLDSSSLFTSLLPTLDSPLPPPFTATFPASHPNAEAGPSTYKRTFTNGRTPTALQISRTNAALAKGKGRAEEELDGDEGDPSYKSKSGPNASNATNEMQSTPSARPTRTHTRSTTGTPHPNSHRNGFLGFGTGMEDDVDMDGEGRLELAGRMMSLHRARKRDLVKFMQLGLMWQEAANHRMLGKQGLHCTSPFKLIGTHTCQPKPLPSILDCLTPFQSDLMREPSAGPLSSPETAADKAMDMTRNRKKGRVERIESKGIGRAGEELGQRDGDGMEFDHVDEGDDYGLSGSGARTKGSCKLDRKDVGTSASASLSTSKNTSPAKSKRDNQLPVLDFLASDQERDMLAVVQKTRKVPSGLEVGKGRVQSRVDREDSVATSGTGKSGGSGGLTATKGGYRVPRVMSPTQGGEDDGQDALSADEELTAVPSKKRKVSTGRERERDAEANGGPGPTMKRKVSAGSSIGPQRGRKSRLSATNGGTGSKGTSPAASGSKASSEFGKNSGNDDATSVAAEVVENPLKPVWKEDGVTHWKVRWHQKGIAWVAWNPVNRNTLVTGGVDASCSIWEFGRPEGAMDVDGAGEELQQLVGLPLNCKTTNIARNKGISQVLWDSQGTIVVAGGTDGNVRAWDVGGAFYGIHARHNGEVNAVAFNPSGSRVVTGGEDKVLSIWNIHLATSRDIDSYHTGPIADIAFLNDDVFATCSEDSVIVLHSTARLGQLARLLGHTAMVNMIRFSPIDAGGTVAGMPKPRRLLASCSDDKSVRIWDVEELHAKAEEVKREDDRPNSGKSSMKIEPVLLRSMRGHTDCVALVEWCPVIQSDGKRLLATRSKTESDNRNAIQVFDVRNGESLYTLTAHSSKIYKLQFEPTTGKCFASCSDDGRMIIWETSTGKQLREHHADCPINDLHWRSDGQQLAMVADDGTLRTMSVGDLLSR